MKQIKKIFISLLAVCLVLSTAGCIVKVNQEKNRNIVVARIDGEHEIKKGEYLDIFNYYVAMYAAYGMDITSDAKQLQTLRESCINALINDKICEIEMDKIDFQINDEDRQKARDDFEEDIKELAEQYKKDAEKEKEEADKDSDKSDSDSDKTDSDTENKDSDNNDAEDKNESEEERDFMQEARDYYAERIKEQGMTEDEYIDEMAGKYRLDRFKVFIMSDITATDEDILEYYNEQLEAQMTTPKLDADILLYEPSGVSYKYIKVALTTEELKKYNEYIDDKKNDEAEKYAKETSYKRAQEYLKRIKDGESFEDVMKDANEYLIKNCGEDEDSIKKPDEELKLYKSVGSTGFAGTLDTKLLSAAKDDVTEVLDAEKGVYVIGKCYGRFESVKHEYEVGNEIHNKIKDALEKKLRDDAWDERLNALKEKHDIKIYMNQLKKNY